MRKSVRGEAIDLGNEGADYSGTAPSAECPFGGVVAE
jgi:hypothetical protein